MNDIFRSIVERKIQEFASTFGEDANKLYKKEDKLIHPLEYGMYRERCAKSLLSVICDDRLGVSDGFLITSSNKVSTQCDIIVYDRESMPIMIENGIANFFPVEVVKAIGEIKSNLKLSDFKEALVKLSTNKKLFMERKGSKSESDNLFGEREEIVSFLICNKLDFNLNNIDFDDVYKEVDIRFRHNAILSLQDGYFYYEMDVEKTPTIVKETFMEKLIIDEPLRWFFPQTTLGAENCKNTPAFDPIDEKDKYLHIINFLIGIKYAVTHQIKYFFDFGTYLTDEFVKSKK